MKEGGMEARNTQEKKRRGHSKRETKREGVRE
jgi:hypothetical protein